MSKIITKSEEDAINVSRVLVRAASIVRDSPLSDDVDRTTIPDVLYYLRDSIEIEKGGDSPGK